MSFFFDVAKAAVNRMAFALAKELQPYNATAVSLTPGWLRSEAMLEAYGVTEDNWRDATAAADFAISESLHLLAAPCCDRPRSRRRRGMGRHV